MCGSMRHIKRWGASMFKCRRNRLRRGAYPATSDGERDNATYTDGGKNTDAFKILIGHESRGGWLDTRALTNL